MREAGGCCDVGGQGRMDTQAVTDAIAELVIEELA